VTSLVPNIVVIDGTSPVTTELNVRHLAENVGPVQVSTVLQSLSFRHCLSQCSTPTFSPDVSVLKKMVDDLLLISLLASLSRFYA